MNAYIGFHRETEMPEADAGHTWDIVAADKAKKEWPVTVHGGDYKYEGWLVSHFFKRSGAVRFVVEDCNGRLFIHSASQIELLKLEE